MKPENDLNPVKKAIEHAGGVAAVASLFEINPVSVYEWIQKRRVPADRSPTLERACNGVVRCEEMCPNVDWGYLRAAQPNGNEEQTKH